MPTAVTAQEQRQRMQAQFIFAEIAGDQFEHLFGDEIHVFIAPKLFGGEKAPSPIGGAGISDVAAALQLENPQIQTLGEDIYLHGYLQNQLPVTTPNSLLPRLASDR